MKKEDVFIVTESLLMRGLDYRAECGIALLIAAPLDNDRAFMQALGRTGRMDDHCKRFVIKGLITVDRKKQQKGHEQLFPYLWDKKKEEGRCHEFFAVSIEVKQSLDMYRKTNSKINND